MADRGLPKGGYFSFGSLEDLVNRIGELGLDSEMGFAPEVSRGGAERWIAKGGRFGPFRITNRFAAHPMEGWDGDPVSGRPTPDVIRRWERMGASGASLLWGLEAFAVDFPFRDNPNQLVAAESNIPAFRDALKRVRAAHARIQGGGDIVIGGQLTCSGRYSIKAPRLVHNHPELDRRTAAAGRTLMSDMEIEDVAAQYGKAARVMAEAGCDFIDIKACHGYWMNETLAAKTRPGKFGGSLENRVRPFFLAVESVRRELGADYPLGCRLSLFDGIPFEEDATTRNGVLKGLGKPSPYGRPYRWGWGVDENEPFKPDLREPLAFVGLLLKSGISMLNLTAGNPYANPHYSRPTETPPTDAYRPPRDPLCEVSMHFSLTAAVKRAYPQASVIGTGYSYLRQFKAHAAEFNLREGRVDAAGLGRALLSYPDEIMHLLMHGEAKPGRGRVICNGNSTCTTGPRLGLRSGCIYDPAYAPLVREIRRRLAQGRQS